jgi:response regulator RpfG family c-di-GMP phosphodiesterase
MRAIAQLEHPNIGGSFDAGQEINPHDPDAPVLHYLVMEYVPGEDMESYVNAHGPLPPGQACDLIGQVASALAEADKHKLIHRDIKPSNIMVTPDGQAKLLDFGLVHHFRNRLTEPRTTMGTVDYMPPEQARDAGTVDIRADVYSLGGTLYWCLTGSLPFPQQGNITQELIQRQTQPPPSVRGHKPEIPVELDVVVKRMMATNPDDRHQAPTAVLRALLPFRRRPSREYINVGGVACVSRNAGSASRETQAAAEKVHRVVIVDDEAEIRDLCRYALHAEGFACAEADNGLRALELIEARPCDLVLLDIDMPEMSGREVLTHLRAAPPWPNLKIIMFSGRAASDDLAQLLLAGADDYLTKPFSLFQLTARVKTALRLKNAQDRSDALQRDLLATNAQLEQNFQSRDSDFVHARNALVLALAKLIEHRAIETGGHLRRMQHYCRCLADEAAKLPSLAEQIDGHFVHMIECCAPLHDIGKIGLPDEVLLKPGKLDPQERIIMQSHTTLGAETLAAIARQHGAALGFLGMAIDIVRHHHERYDGQGYPDRLAGAAIPLAARVVAVADAYDALRTRNLGRPPLSHADALQVMAETSQGQLDPLLIQAFQHCASHFEQIYRETPD